MAPNVQIALARNIRNGKSKFNVLLVAALVIKLLCCILAGVALAFVKEYHNSYMIAVIISAVSCTYIYIAVSVITNFCVACICNPEEQNCHFLEAFASLLLFCGWMLSAGIATEISLRAGARTTELFAWVGACCGLNTALFAMLSVMFSMPVVRSVMQESESP